LLAVAGRDQRERRTADEGSLRNRERAYGATRVGAAGYAGVGLNLSRIRLSRRDLETTLRVRALNEVNMRKLRCLGLSAVVALATGALHSSALAAEKPFVAPKVGRAYAKAVERLPDFNGAWGKTEASLTDAQVFDPANLFKPELHENDIGMDVGPLPGSYIKGIPYTPEAAEQYKATIQAAIEGRSEDAVGVCQPYGMPRIMHGAPYGPQIFMTPDVIIMALFKGETRFIYMDGRPHPKDGLLSWQGHSVGHWEGDTLVVETVDIYEGMYDQTGARHSDQIRVLERYRLLSENILEVDMTIEDPVMFTAPWRVVRTYKRMPKRPDIFNHVCPPGSGNGKDLDFSDGYQRVILPFERDSESE
jgi:hypothetical protein